MFHIGQKVVCVDDKQVDFPRVHGKKEKFPKANEVYTIRGFKEFPNGLGMVLEEIVNPPLLYRTGVDELYFRSTRFRPVKTTNIDVFTAMLNPTPADIKKVLEEV